MKKPATTEPYCQPHVELQLPLPLLSRLRAVREGFFELCIRVGEQALHALMEQARTALCGAKWSRDRRAERGAGRLDRERDHVGRASAARPAACAPRRSTVPSWPCRALAGPPIAIRSMIRRGGRIVAGVSARSYGASLDPVPAELRTRATSRSAVSRRFVALSQRQLTTCLSRPLGDLDLQVVMIDGIAYHGAEVGRDRWTLSLQFTFLETVDPELMIVNPMGILITYLRGDRALVTG